METYMKNYSLTHKKFIEQSTTKAVLPFADYCRIFRVIYSVLEGSGAKTPRACKFFAVAGALILRNHYKLDALVMAGAAAYAVGRSPINNDVRIATFGHEENGQLLCSP